MSGTQWPASLGDPVSIDGELRVETEASIWLIRPDRYMRLPKSEGPRPEPASTELRDNMWHPHVGVWKVTDAYGTFLRILPPGRSKTAYGIVTGLVLATSDDAA